MDFLNYLNTQINLSEKAIESLKKSIRRKTYTKKELILPVENTSKQIYFIEQGCARVFYAKKNKDVTLYFLQENNIGLPIDSIFYNQICKFGIEALAETKVVAMSYKDWEILAENDKVLYQFSQRLMIDYIKKATDRLYNLKFQTPRERYDTMLGEFPNLQLYAPLGYIASFLGITQETLSRLRATR